MKTRVDWAERDLRKDGGQPTLPAKGSYPRLKKPATEGWNSGIKISDRGKSKSRTSSYTKMLKQ